MKKMPIFVVLIFMTMTAKVEAGERRYYLSMSVLQTTKSEYMVTDDNVSRLVTGRMQFYGSGSVVMDSETLYMRMEFHGVDVDENELDIECLTDVDGDWLPDYGFIQTYDPHKTSTEKFKGILGCETIFTYKDGRKFDMGNGFLDATGTVSEKRNTINLTGKLKGGTNIFPSYYLPSVMGAIYSANISLQLFPLF